MTQAAPTRAPDGALSAGAGALPSWDLADLYAAPDSPAIEADLARTQAEAQVFANDYQGKLASLPGADLARAMARFEAPTNGSSNSRGVFGGAASRL